MNYDTNPPGVDLHLKDWFSKNTLEVLYLIFSSLSNIGGDPSNNHGYSRLFVLCW